MTRYNLFLFLARLSSDNAHHEMVLTNSERYAGNVQFCHRYLLRLRPPTANLTKVPLLINEMTDATRRNPASVHAECESIGAELVSLSIEPD